MELLAVTEISTAETVPAVPLPLAGALLPAFLLAICRLAPVLETDPLLRVILLPVLAFAWLFFIRKSS